MSAFDDFVSNIFGAAASAGSFAVGTVTVIEPGAAVDGNAKVTVAWQGAAVAAPYSDAYTPALDDVVLMARVGPQLVILCRLIGTPA